MRAAPCISCLLRELLSGKSLRNRRTPEAVETMQSEGGDEEEEEEEESSGQEIEESQEEWSGWGWLGGEIGRPGERGGFKEAQEDKCMWGTC